MIYAIPKSRDIFSCGLTGNSSAGIRVLTCSEKNAELIDRLDDIKDDLVEYGIEFDYTFRDFHDRAITTDDGWRIVPGRGIDIYEKYSPYSVASSKQARRKCKEFSVDYLRVNGA